MGKRKRRVHLPPIAPLSTPDSEPCSSGMNPLEKPSIHISTRIPKPHSSTSTEDIMDSHEEQNDHHHHHHHHHNNPGRSMHSKRSRNRGRHNPGYHYNTYHGKNNPSFDHQIHFKAGNRWTPELGHITEGRERAFHKPERIRSNEIPMEVIPKEDDDDIMVCGTCERLLRQKHPLGSGLLNSEPSVVAVLVCGHFFHADCLEMRTEVEDASDPKCPLCFTN